MENYKELIDRAALLDLEMKRMKTELDSYKEELKTHFGHGKHVGYLYEVNIMECAECSVVEPSKLYDYLGDLTRFFRCVKVDVTATTKEIGLNTLNIMREIIGVTKRVSFKEIKK